MLPRANWNGFLRLSLVTCPVALYPATSESEKITFNQINRETGHRIKYLKVNSETGDEVPAEDIVKGFKIDTDNYVTVEPEEIERIKIESSHTIEIDEFVDRADIDQRYVIRPYYLIPDGKMGHDAYAVIRETIRSMNKVAIGRLVLTSREHMIALEPLKKGVMGLLLRYSYEVCDETDYFAGIKDAKVTKEMVDLAKHIVTQKSGVFDPEKFEDRYEAALTDPIDAKRAGKTIKAKPLSSSENVIDLMDALKKSIAGKRTAPPAPARARQKKSAKAPAKSASGCKRKTA